MKPKVRLIALVALLLCILIVVLYFWQGKQEAAQETGQTSIQSSVQESSQIDSLQAERHRLWDLYQSASALRDEQRVQTILSDLHNVNTEMESLGVDLTTMPLVEPYAPPAARQLSPAATTTENDNGREAEGERTGMSVSGIVWLAIVGVIVLVVATMIKKKVGVVSFIGNILTRKALVTFIGDILTKVTPHKFTMKVNLGKWFSLNVQNKP